MECTGSYETAISSVTACGCDTGFAWDAVEGKCLIICGGVADSSGSRLADPSTGDLAQD